ncbi:MAG: hypothetical protein ABGW92_02525 [Methanocaldococcus sp.]
MAVAYAKIYELILKNIKDEKKAEELYKAVEEFIKENEKRIEDKFKNEKVIIKHELKDELKNELATKEDVLLAEERLERKIEVLEQQLKGEMKAMEERLMRYVDNRFNQLDKKMTVGFIILIILYVVSNPNAIELIKLLFGVK